MISYLFSFLLPCLPYARVYHVPVRHVLYIYNKIEIGRIVSWMAGSYRILGNFRGVLILRISRFYKVYTHKSNNLYGSHLIFDRFAKI